jgi:hypothetical protein
VDSEPELVCEDVSDPLSEQEGEDVGVGVCDRVTVLVRLTFEGEGDSDVDLVHEPVLLVEGLRLRDIELLPDMDSLTLGESDAARNRRYNEHAS